MTENLKYCIKMCC